MTTVTTQEFNANSQKYFDMAVNSDVCIRNNQYLVRLLCQPIDVVDEQMILQPDDAFYNSITAEEMRDRLHKVLDKLYAKA